MSTGEQFVYSIIFLLLFNFSTFCWFFLSGNEKRSHSMTRRVFNFLLAVFPASLLAKTESARGVTVTLSGLDPRFVAQLRIAAKSREKTLEQWIVFACLIMSGYTLNSGFVSDQKNDQQKQ